MRCTAAAAWRSGVRARSLVNDVVLVLAPAAALPVMYHYTFVPSGNAACCSVLVNGYFDVVDLDRVCIR